MRYGGPQHLLTFSSPGSVDTLGAPLIERQIDIDAGLPVKAAGQEAWFRAEIGEDGVVDQVILLNVPAAFASGSINDQLRERLSLRYADERRHRGVVFGAVRVNVRGHLVMTRSRVILPKCCCGGVHCI